MKIDCLHGLGLKQKEEGAGIWMESHGRHGRTCRSDLDQLEFHGIDRSLCGSAWGNSRRARPVPRTVWSRGPWSVLWPCHRQDGEEFRRCQRQSRSMLSDGDEVAMLQLMGQNRLIVGNGSWVTEFRAASVPGSAASAWPARRGRSMRGVEGERATRWGFSFRSQEVWV